MGTFASNVETTMEAKMVLGKAEILDAAPSAEKRRTATMIRELKSFRGHAVLFKLEPPYVGVAVYKASTEQPKTISHVVVSCVVAFGFGGCPETYIFPANSEGEVLDWGELEGSFRGEFDMERALKGLGYEALPMAVTETAGA